MIPGRFDFDADVNALVVAPSVFREARETSALAGVSMSRLRSAQCRELLALIEQAGADGLSDPEIAQRTGWSRQTICIRRFDLRPFLVPTPRRMKSPSGRWCVCWRRATTAELEARS